MKFCKYILYLIFIVFPFGQIIRFRLPFFPPAVKIQPLDFLVCLFVISWIIFKKGKIKKSSIFNYSIPLLLVAVFSFSVHTPMYNLSEILPSFFYLIRLVVYFMFFWTLNDFLTAQKTPVIKYLALAGMVTAVIATLQYLIMPDMRFLYQSGWDDHLYRAVGAFLDPAYTSIILILTLIIFLNGRIIEINKKANLMFIIFIAVVIVLTFSRTAYLLTFILLIYYVFQKKQKLFFVLLAVFLLAIIFVPKPTGEGVDLFRKRSIILKYENYRQGILVIKNNILLGVGYNYLRPNLRNTGFLPVENWEYSNAGAGLDNSFLFVFATTGILGLIFFVWWIYFLIKIPIKNIKKDNCRILLFSLLVIIIESFFVNAFFYPWILVWLFAVIAQIISENGL